MSYYGAGDYYGAGGLGSFLGGVVRTVGGAVGGFATGGITGAIGGAIRGATGGSAQPRLSSSGRKQLVVPPVAITPGAFLPGGEPLVSMAGGRRRRRMNYANGKALTRANRRVDGFVRLARKSLKHTNYKIVTKQASSRSSRRSPSIMVETGPGSIRG